MKLPKTVLWAQVLMLLTLFSGCCRNREDLWDDSKTCGRYMGCGVRSLGGKHGSSRQVRCREEFSPYGNGDDDYFRLTTDDPAAEYYAISDVNYPQAQNLPGDHGSTIPGIDAFSDPSLQPQLAGVFQNIYFAYDDPLVKGDQNLRTVHNIGNYLRNNPHTYVFVEGHTDERGPDSYNLALGLRRSNSVRNMLIDEGVSPNQLFTISYGKERPLVMEHHEEGWSKNRRAEFKIYQR